MSSSSYPRKKVCNKIYIDKKVDLAPIFEMLPALGLSITVLGAAARGEVDFQ